MNRACVSVSQADWSLHRKGPRDQERHKQLVQDAIRDNLPDLVAREDLISGGADGKMIRVPIRHRQLPKFRYDPNDGSDRVGQGSGKTKVGDVIGHDPNDPNGQGGQAGDDEGNEWYEEEVPFEDVVAAVFEDLELPFLEARKTGETTTEEVVFNDVRRTGVMGNLDKRRTILENMKRNARSGRGAKFVGVRSEDLRFKTWNTPPRPCSNAVVIAMMDVSGSMGDFEKYMARSFYMWMVRFLRTKYDNVEVVFITHTTTAKEVAEKEFFTTGESGGTKVSSAYTLALSIIEARYPSADWNIYPFHFSDGDNAWTDNPGSARLIETLLKVCNLFGYGQVKQGWYPGGTLIDFYTREIRDPRYIGVTIHEADDVYLALMEFFRARGIEIPERA